MTGRLTGYDLAGELAGRLLSLYQAADSRIGADDDLHIVLDVTAQTEAMAREFEAIIEAYWKRSWRFRFVRLSTVLVRTGRLATEVYVVGAVADLCHDIRLGASDAHRRARRDAASSRANRLLLGCRERTLDGLWMRLGQCVRWSDYRFMSGR
jgi:hypothetical protein